jgi:type 1 glutamine amidotransferase
MHALFRRIPGIDVYFQHMEEFTTDEQMNRDWYDVVLFFQFLQETPGPESHGLMQHGREALDRLGEKEGQGIFVLHHSILALGNYKTWHDIVGVSDYGWQGGYHIGETVPIHVAKPDHPITQGLEDWEMTDETYEMNEPDDYEDILLTIDHPLSMKTCGWTRRHKNARVFCLQSGHDNLVWSHKSFETVVGRGIQWCAGRI